MKNMIERYIYDVVRRLPDENKEEVKKELNANIDDMLGENRSDDHIEKVLLELGEPRLLALKYQTKERYLISPAYYDDYIRVLKIVIIIFISITLVGGAIDLLVNLNNVTPWEMIGQVLSKLIGDSISSIFSSFAFVTLVFWLIEKTEAKGSRKIWSLSKLPELPKQNVYKIKRTGAVISLIIESVCILILIMLPVSYVVYLGIYEYSVMVAPIFTKEVIEAFIPLLITKYGGVLY